jgi:hypothetical protein
MSEKAARENRGTVFMSFKNQVLHFELRNITRALKIL